MTVLIDDDVTMAIKLYLPEVAGDGELGIHPVRFGHDERTGRLRLSLNLWHSAVTHVIWP